MMPREIIGVALHSDDVDEIKEVILSNITQYDEDKLAACAHSVGHLVRRFKVNVDDLRDLVLDASMKVYNSSFLNGAIEDMKSDIETFYK